MKPRCVILGGGGHARVLIDSLRRSDAAIVHGILDANQDLWGTMCLDVPILGGDDLLSELAAGGILSFTIGVGGVGDNEPRRRAFERALSHRLTPLTVVHPAAIPSRWATIGPGSQLLAGAIVNAGAALGVNVLINSGAIVEHDCRIGNHSHVASGATLSGAVRVGEGVHVGVGAAVRQSITIGDNAVIGAGAVVIRDVEPRQVVVGNPARVQVA